MCQSQDGKAVSSGCELSELMKRRLESVASTGSSASSGFIEDKSYCDSEEEDEGKAHASLPSLHLPPLFVAPTVSRLPLSPLLHPSCLETHVPPWLFSCLSLMGHFLLLFSSTIAAAGATVTPLSLGRRLFISCPDLTISPVSGSSVGLVYRPCCSWCVISGLIGCLLRWTSGRTPPEFLCQTPNQHNGPIITGFTWHQKNKICFYLSCVKDVFKSESGEGEAYVTGQIC